MHTLRYHIDDQYNYTTCDDWLEVLPLAMSCQPEIQECSPTQISLHDCWMWCIYIFETMCGPMYRKKEKKAPKLMDDQLWFIMQLQKRCDTYAKTPKL